MAPRRKHPGGGQLLSLRTTSPRRQLWTDEHGPGAPCTPSGEHGWAGADQPRVAGCHKTSRTRARSDGLERWPLTIKGTRTCCPTCELGTDTPKGMIPPAPKSCLSPPLTVESLGFLKGRRGGGTLFAGGGGRMGPGQTGRCQERGCSPQSCPAPATPPWSARSAVRSSLPGRLCACAPSTSTSEFFPEAPLQTRSEI